MTPRVGDVLPRCMFWKLRRHHRQHILEAHHTVRSSIFQTLTTTTVNSATHLQCNINGSALTRHPLEFTDNTLEIDVVSVQEGRTPYTPRARPFVAFDAHVLDNYRAYNDPLLKTLIYVHRRHSQVQQLCVPSHENTTHYNNEHHYYETWVLIKPCATNALRKHIVCGSYYKSSQKCEDITNLAKDLDWVARTCSRDHIAQ